jgi:hypothetical protein
VEEQYHQNHGHGTDGEVDVETPSPGAGLVVSSEFCTPPGWRQEGRREGKQVLTLYP